MFECVTTNLDLEKKDDVNVNNKLEKIFGVKLLKFIVLGLTHTDETKKKLLIVFDDEIKCSKKGRTTKW